MSFATTMVVEATAAVIGINQEFVAIRVSTDVVDFVKFHLDEFMSLATVVEI